MQTLHIIKIGGNVIDDKAALHNFLQLFSKINEPKILVHGGGKLATELANKLGIEQTLIEGRRITNAATLDITTMVYSGLINKNIVAKLQALHCNAIGLCGADANIITTSKRIHPTIDYGFVGDIQKNSVDVNALQFFITHDLTPIINSITHNHEGVLLNTNADTIAASIAIALSPQYNTNLVYCFEKKGVLQKIDDENSYIENLTLDAYTTLKKEGIINKGMIPKLDNAFDAIKDGVQQVRICSAENIINPTIGTLIA